MIWWTVCLLLSCLSLARGDSCPDMHIYGPYGAQAIVEYVSVEATNHSAAVRRRVVVPSNSTLLQGMLVAQHEHGPREFTFETIYNEQYGHFITSINGVENNYNDNNYYWMVYDAETDTRLPCGVDSTYPENDAHFIWKYKYIP
ncbi:uncharacterized protein LOC117104516 [Anneissia japonica]|uniref:uncharacterized protein LOC117104516 n=1 Tax=Anneissia japonica TaxID=1529436 RepID=UPI001425962D|nr:uncharacterized protein LOC117104516 [Anneissia japonica]